MSPGVVVFLLTVQTRLGWIGIISVAWNFDGVMVREKKLQVLEFAFCQYTAHPLEPIPMVERICIETEPIKEVLDGCIRIALFGSTGCAVRRPLNGTWTATLVRNFACFGVIVWMNMLKAKKTLDRKNRIYFCRRRWDSLPHL